MRFITLKRMLLLAVVMLMAGATANAVNRKTLFDDGWRFYLGEVDGAESAKEKSNSWKAVNLPHDWSATMSIDEKAPSGNDGGYYPTGMGWYYKAFTLPKDCQNKKIWLYFEGVYQNSEVYVNGKRAGGHPYGYSTFYCDITPYVKAGSNDVAVKVDNSTQKNCRWYSGSGIYRHVWMVMTDPIYIDMWGIQVTTPDKNTVVVKTDVLNETAENKDITVVTTLSDGTKGQQTVTVMANGHKEVAETLKVAEPKLWEIDAPNLYKATVSLSSGDSAEETFGIRTIEYSVTKGLTLNGKSILLNGGCVHHDNGILGAAAFDKAELRKVELLKSAGFNAVRTAHNPPSEAFLAACDKVGLLVIDEVFDGWRDEKNKEDYHKLFDEWYKEDVKAMVKRDRNHPSIFCWSVGNEVIERKKIEVVTTARHLRDAVRQWDTTRPVTSALAAWDSDWEIYDPLAAQMDITGYNYMIHKAESDHQRVPERVMMQTESFPRDAFGCWKKVHDREYVIGDFVWTAVDYLGESGIGRYWYDGDVAGEHYHRPMFPWHGAYCGDIDLIGNIKPIGHYRNLLWNDTEKLYMAVREPNGWKGKINTASWAVWPTWESWDWKGWDGKDIEVEVCSKYPVVRLYQDDVLVGEKNVGLDSRYQALFTVKYKPGTLRVEGVDNGVVRETKTLTTSSEPYAIRMSTASNTLKADGQDLAFVKVEVIDREGRLVTDADNLVSFSIKGQGDILAVGNADIKDLTPFTALSWKAWKGRLMVVVRSGNKAGTVTLNAVSKGLKPTAIGMKCIKK